MLSANANDLAFGSKCGCCNGIFTFFYLLDGFYHLSLNHWFYRYRRNNYIGWLRLNGCGRHSLISRVLQWRSGYWNSLLIHIFNTFWQLGKVPVRIECELQTI